MKRFVTPAFVVLAWTAGHAAASGFGAPAAGAELSPGRSAAASFELPLEMSDVKEMELVLSLDGGITYPLRLTGELDPRSRHVSWRVPALPTTKAVLALRAGNEEGDEQIVLQSAPFTIRDDPSAPLEDIRFAQGEWRTREAGFEGASPFAGPSLGTESEERLFALATSTDLAEGRPQSLVPPLCADGLSATTTDAAPPLPFRHGSRGFPVPFPSGNRAIRPFGRK